jgi:uncharacterized protein YqgV (UPF0045/DUF77 family)
LSAFKLISVLDQGMPSLIAIVNPLNLIARERGICNARSTIGLMPGQIDYRTDKEQTAEDKVNKVRQLLAQDKQ